MYLLGTTYEWTEQAQIWDKAIKSTYSSPHLQLDVVFPW